MYDLVVVRTLPTMTSPMKGAKSINRKETGGVSVTDRLVVCEIGGDSLFRESSQ